MDNLTKQQRSYNMSRIQSKNSKPETRVRHFLFSKGFRYRKNVKTLPGCPDIVLKKYKTIIFVNGCFWHKHDCPKFVLPKSNVDYWLNKVERNRTRDIEIINKLAALDWNVITIWECQLNKNNIDNTFTQLVVDIKNNKILSGS
jgi:DNA mismatch endonuclease (patch repair protein)